MLIRRIYYIATPAWYTVIALTKSLMTHECCPKFDPKTYENKQLHWKNKLFIKDSIPLFLHRPWPPMVGKLIGKMWKQIKDADAAPEMKDFIWLAYDPSPWRGEQYLHVTKKVPNAENVILTGTFLTKVFDGPYNAVPKWIKEMNVYVKKKNKKVKKYYFYCTTCPKCAKKYGHNYVVAFAEVE